VDLAAQSDRVHAAVFERRLGVDLALARRVTLGERGAKRRQARRVRLPEPGHPAQEVAGLGVRGERRPAVLAQVLERTVDRDIARRTADVASIVEPEVARDTG